MKKIILLLVVCLLSQYDTSFAQSIKEVENKQVSSLLTFVEDLKTFGNDNMSIKVFKIGLPSDTIPNSRSEEIYNRLLISISEKGEYPKYKLFELSQLYNPSELTFSFVDPFIGRLEFIYGKYKQRKAGVFEVNVKTLSIEKIQ